MNNAKKQPARPRTNPRFNAENDGTRYWIRDRDGSVGYVESLSSADPGDFVNFSDPEQVGLVQVLKKPNGTLHCRGKPAGFGRGPEYTFQTSNLVPDEIGRIRDRTTTSARAGYMNTPGGNLYKERV